jgi:hypothetical protein
MARISDTHITTLLGAGADAMTNMYEVEFIPPAGMYSDQGPALKIRTKGFTPPEPKQKEYEVHYKTTSAKKTATKIELERTLEFEIRVDAYYDVYKCLLEWQSYSMIASVGYAGNDTRYGTGKIIVKALDNPIVGIGSRGAVGDISTETTVKWVFEDVYLPDMTPPAYTSEDAEAATVTAKFTFGNYIDPQTILVGLA